MKKMMSLIFLVIFSQMANGYYDGSPGNEKYRIATKEECASDPVISFLNTLYYDAYVKQIADREAVDKQCKGLAGTAKEDCYSTARKKQDAVYFKQAIDNQDGNAVGSSPGTQMGMASSYLEKYRSTGELPSFRYIPGAMTAATAAGLKANNLDSKVLENLNNELNSAQADEKTWLAKMNAKSCRQYWGQGAVLAQCEAEQKEIANQVTRAQHRITNTKSAIKQYNMVGYVGAEMQKAADGTGQAPNGYNDQIGADGSGYPWTKPSGMATAATASTAPGKAVAPVGSSLTSGTEATNNKSVISEEERKRLQETRSRISREAMADAIELFYGAVATYAEDEVARQVLGIENLSDALDTSVGVVDKNIGKMDQAGGQFDTTNKAIDNQIAAKIKQLDAQVAEATKQLEGAKKDVAQYGSCSGSRSAGQSYSDCNRKYEDAKNRERQWEAKLRQAQKARAAYGEKEQTLDMTKKEGAISDSKNVIKDAEGPRNQALVAGEKLYSAQEKLNKFINDRSVAAIQVARKAKEVAVALLKTNVNNQFDLSDQAQLIEGMTVDERDLLKRVANEDAAQKYIDLYALVGSGAQHFKCETDSDVECVSYHLMVAASAIYLAAQIRETTDFNLNAADIKRTDENPEKSYDEQYKNLLRAAKMREELLRTAQARMEMQQILQDMLTRVNGIAQLELVAKKTRIAAAEQQVKKAEENLKKVKMSIAIMVGIKLVEELVIQKSLAVAAVNWACCGPHSAGCCAMAAKFQALASTWQAKLAVTVAAIAYYGNELIKAQKELKRAKAELAAAKKHTHLRCWKDMSSNPTESASIMQRKWKSWAVAMTAALMPVAYADDSSAIGEQQNTGIYKYYREHKEKDADAQAAAYPTPETRASYMQNVVLEVAKHSVDGSSEYLDTFATQNYEYSKIVDNMNDSARVNETGQVLGSNMSPKMKGLDTSKLGGKTVTPGMLDFGSLSQFNVTQKRTADANRINLQNATTQSGAVDGNNVGGRKAAANIKDARSNNAKAQDYLAKMKNKATVPKDDSYKKYTRDVLEKFAQNNPNSRAFVNKAIADLNKLADPPSAEGKGTGGSKVVEEKTDLTLTDGAKNEVGASDSAVKDDSGVIFDEGDDSADTAALAVTDAQEKKTCEAADGSKSSVGCMTEEEKLSGEEALRHLQHALGSDFSSGTTSNGTEVGIYAGKDSLFTQISKRYVKSALPVFFEKKKK